MATSLLVLAGTAAAYEVVLQGADSRLIFDQSLPTELILNSTFVTALVQNVTLHSADISTLKAGANGLKLTPLSGPPPTCDSTTKGTIVLSSGAFLACNGNSWLDLSATSVGSIEKPGRSCLDIKQRSPAAASGMYWIDPDGALPEKPFKVMCEMDRDGGGWTLGIKNFGGASMPAYAGAWGSIEDAMTLRSQAYKLSDTQIRNINGCCQFDVLADQVGFNAAYSQQNAEYVILRNYTAVWRFAGLTAESFTPTKMESWAFSSNAPDYLNWEGRLECQSWSGDAGINCYNVLAGSNPAAGAGCRTALGTSTSTTWHSYMMGSGDTYLYICNGAQHSSSYLASHRFWFREQNYNTSTSGLWASTAGRSCKDIKTRFPQAESGYYWVKPDPAIDPVQVQCEMTRDGGGWTLGVKSWYGGGTNGRADAMGDVAVAHQKIISSYKLADTTIRALAGNKYDVMGDQTGFQSAQSDGNFEYVILRDYTAAFSFASVTPESTTPTTMQSYRISDNALAWTGRLGCGYFGGWGINCYPTIIGDPKGGQGCNINMGKAGGGHHFFMSESNADTYLYVCNGNQHSSSYGFNHRWWFREQDFGTVAGLKTNDVGVDCLDIKTRYPSAKDGFYWIQPDVNFPAFQAHCDMTLDGGGWTLGIKNWYGSGVHGQAGNVNEIGDAKAHKQRGYKLSDEQIRSITGNRFDVMVDHTGFQSAQSNGAYEYVVLRNYTAAFSFSTRMSDSSTVTSMQSYRKADQALAWTGRIECGYAGGVGINCLNVVSGVNPQGGPGCSINMGKAGGIGSHHFFMSETNGDTYVYICNGNQHSSGYDMNPRWWFRRNDFGAFDGLTSDKAGKTCKDIKTRFPGALNGFYWIRPDPSMSPFRVQCDMSRDGGGWTMVVKPWYQAGVANVEGAYGNLGDALSHKQTPWKLSDDQIRAIAGTKFSIMGDQSGFNSAYSNGNYEYVILRNYTGTHTFFNLMAESRTPTTLQSYRVADNALAYTGRLNCGSNYGTGWGVNCYTPATGFAGPQGGAGCSINMGKAGQSADANRFAMSASNADTYLYVCNGQQHSSSYDLNHRFWYREETFSPGVDGLTSDKAGKTCADIKARFSSAEDGVYWISPNGWNGAPFQVQCDMTRDGGGWTMGVKNWYQSGVHGVTGDMGSIGEATVRKNRGYKLSDEKIKLIIGADNQFDLMGDQEGFNAAYSNVNAEYILIKGYTAVWRFDAAMPESSTVPTFYSFRASDRAQAWTGRLTCGKAGVGINCEGNVAPNTAPQGGTGCSINMGKAVNVGWNTLAMSWSDSNTLMYVCNGAQHSSGYDMNHRWWFR